MSNNYVKNELLNFYIIFFKDKGYTNYISFVDDKIKNIIKNLETNLTKKYINGHKKYMVTEEFKDSIESYIKWIINFINSKYQINNANNDSFSGDNSSNKVHINNIKSILKSYNKHNYKVLTKLHHDISKYISNICKIIISNIKNKQKQTRKIESLKPILEQ